MQLVVHPTCDGCGSRNPDFEGIRFKIRLCYQCIRVVAKWLIHRDLADENPIAEELLDGVWEGSEEHQYLVWYESEYDSRAHSQTWVRRPAYGSTSSSDDDGVESRGVGRLDLDDL